MSQCKHIESNIDNHLGIITLNRPEALNALSLDMIRALYSILIEWQKNNQVYAVVIQAIPGKAFCAGGDVRALMSLDSIEAQMQFFGEEYRLNQLIHDYPKPYIALLDGITMGGGVGISLHGNYPLATTNFKFAMPETKIGFFPDIGASYLLNRCPDSWGLYLALTGAIIKADLAQHLGLIFGQIEAGSINEILKNLKNISSFTEVEPLLQEFLIQPSSSLEPVNPCFQKGGLQEILACNPLPDCAPLSLWVTYTQLHRVKNLPLSECLKIDYNLAYNFMLDNNFKEGVRARLIDKDHQPIWSPAHIEDVSEAQVEAFFSGP